MVARTAVGGVLGLISVSGLSTFVRAEPLLVNPGFETVLSTTPPSQWPTDAGYWAGDGSAIVGTADGILPFDGSHMLQFIWTSSQGHATSYGASEVIQIVGLASYHDAIRAGLAAAAMSCRFNRVAGDGQTDSEFGVRLLAFAGATDTFLSQYQATGWLAESVAVVNTDAALGTWETVGAIMQLPTATDFLAVQVFASENVFNDTTGVEFDGHFADGAQLTIVPEPVALPLLAGCGCALIRRRRRRVDLSSR